MPEILIVDDSVSVRKALEITFRNHALDSRSASSGEQALDMLDEAAACDLLMVDVIMPGMSGLELCSRLKADARSAHLPVILMSGNVDDEVRAQAREAGASGVLRKPFRSEELIPLVQEVLAAHRQTAGDAEATGPAPAAPAIDDGDLGALNALLQTYEDHPQVRDVVILDRQGQPLKQTGNVLPENIQLFARFFTNTAGVLGRQMLGEDIDQVSIRYGAHQMVIHNLPGHFVVVLMGAPESAARVVN
ncbi:response regulator [Deinococcus gobiensis]|uniref:Response regulator n=1 Tax=Deinococcus gobiensis (strain DSM 21396 / JCM 16679 / CGMCC 1.7299 / I-0) TaxID=745776 RepID=H8H0N7_DEIGI|nr:response regulator [Deinococcus gobiensis]AFD26906.1 Response regulator [Deinococcus gobiensis I-0]